MKHAIKMWLPRFQALCPTVLGFLGSIIFFIIDSLSESHLTELKKMAAILKTPDLALVGTKGGDVVLKVCDKKNDTSNNFDIVVGEGATADYTFYFKVENLKMISGDYDVSVSSKSISHFKNKKLPIEYWIALEPDSSISK
mgnify:CR=1 FL=1